MGGRGGGGGCQTQTPSALFHTRTPSPSGDLRIAQQRREWLPGSIWTQLWTTEWPSRDPLGPILMLHPTSYPPLCHLQGLKEAIRSELLRAVDNVKRHPHPYLVPAVANGHQDF